MKLRLIRFLEEIRYSFWFVPAVMMVGALILAVFTINLDGEVRFEWNRLVPFIWTGGADGARELLSMVAGSMITVTGVVFSITIVALSMASTQFGPRLLRNFMRDSGNQFVLGAFISTFLYCLLILRTVRSSEEISFVPQVSVTVAVVLAILSLIVMVYFIHHVALSVQAPQIISDVAGSLLEKINHIYPGELGQEPPDENEYESLPAWRERFDREGWPVAAPRSGYLQAIDSERLLQIAVENDLVVHILHRPGLFVIEGDEIAQVFPGPARKQLSGEINAVFLVGRQRSSAQDLEFAVHQLVEMAVRALSTGINDPFTAITCIDWLGAVLSRLAKNSLPSPYRCDPQGRLRLVIARPQTYAGVVDAAFNQIRQFSEGDISVQIHLLEVIQIVLERTGDEKFRQALIRQAQMIEHSSRENVSERKDRQDLRERYQRVMETLARQE